MAARAGAPARLEIRGIELCSMTRLLSHLGAWDCTNQTGQRRQKTLIGLPESLLVAAPWLKADLHAEPPTCRVLPDHSRLRPRPISPAPIGVLASTRQRSPEPQALVGPDAK